MPGPIHQIEYVTVRAPRWWAWYVVSTLLIIGSILVPCGGIMGLGIASLSPHGNVLTPPGSITLSVQRPGPQVIWIDQPDNPAQLVTPAPEVPTDFKAKVTGPDGAEVPTTVIRESKTESTMNSQRTGALSFQATDPGDYVVKVDKALQGKLGVAVSADEGDTGAAMGFTAIALVVLGVVMFVVGVVLLIVTIVRHSRWSPA